MDKTYLYIKKHTESGLKYLGKTQKNNTLSKGIFTCHFYNHHKDCNPYV